MRDEETGSWWQQVTGEAIFGPLKGQHLRSVFHDELTFGLWQQENPHGRVLRPDEAVARDGKYAPANWEERMAKVPVATTQLDASFGARALVVGLTVNGAAIAYPFDALLKQSPILDDAGRVPKDASSCCVVATGTFAIRSSQFAGAYFPARATASSGRSTLPCGFSCCHNPKVNSS